MIDGVAEMTCTGCSEHKDESEFARDKSKKSGRKSRCKACDRAKSARYYRTNIEARREAGRAYYAANVDVRKAYYREHVEEIAAARDAVRAAVRRIYGGVCVRCGATDELELDHVNDDGREHRQVEAQWSLYCRIARTGERVTDWELQLLCPEHHREKTAQDRAKTARYPNGRGPEPRRLRKRAS